MSVIDTITYKEQAGAIDSWIITFTDGRPPIITYEDPNGPGNGNGNQTAKNLDMTTLTLVQLIELKALLTTV